MDESVAGIEEKKEDRWRSFCGKFDFIDAMPQPFLEHLESFESCCWTIAELERALSRLREDVFLSLENRRRSINENEKEKR